MSAPTKEVMQTRYARGERLRRLQAWVPAAAVSMMAAVAVMTAFMSERYEPQDLAVQQPAVLLAEKQAGGHDAAKKDLPAGIVTAPPLKPAPRPPRAAKGAEPRAPTQVLGGATGCRNCGVVETVVAVHGYAQPQASGYQMHIRMDDGSMRTVEQRGALAAGSRVRVERDSVRSLGGRAG